MNWKMSSWPEGGSLGGDRSSVKTQGGAHYIKEVEMLDIGERNERSICREIIRNASRSVPWALGLKEMESIWDRYLRGIVRRDVLRDEARKMLYVEEVAA